MQTVSALGRDYLFHHPPNCPRANQRKFCSTGHCILFIYFRKSHRNRRVSLRCGCILIFCGPSQDTVLICVSPARGEMPNALLVCFLFSNLRDMHGHILCIGNSETSPMLQLVSACPPSLSIKCLPNAFPRCLVAVAAARCSTISRL